MRQRLERGPLTFREILDIGIKTASALAAAHAASIADRDIMRQPDAAAQWLHQGARLRGRDVRAPPRGSPTRCDHGTAAETSPAPSAAPSHTCRRNRRGSFSGRRVGSLQPGRRADELVTCWCRSRRRPSPTCWPRSSNVSRPHSGRGGRAAAAAPTDHQKALEKLSRPSHQTIADLPVDWDGSRPRSGRPPDQSVPSRWRRRRCAPRAT